MTEQVFPHKINDRQSLDSVSVVLNMNGMRRPERGAEREKMHPNGLFVCALPLVTLCSLVVHSIFGPVWLSLFLSSILCLLSIKVAPFSHGERERESA